MSEENIFFIPVKEHCHRQLITCHIKERVQGAARLMSEKEISSLIVTDDQEVPIGILTDRDLRKKIVASGLDPSTTPVSSIMTSPVISVQEEDNLFEVLYQMSRHRIHRIGVVDRQNRLIGIINESDIIRLQNRSPQQLLRGIDEAGSIGELKVVYQETEQLIVFLSKIGVRTRDMVRLISFLNDQIALRLIRILAQEGSGRLPEGFAFLVLGSEGRREQTLKTDQDNAIIYVDDLSAGEVETIQAFSQQLIAALIEIGVPECPGGIMACNDFWRRSLSDWQRTLDRWIAVPSGENILNFSMFSDMRTLWGDSSLEQRLREHVVNCAQKDGLFLSHMAANVCRFTPPLGYFGRIKTERTGEHSGEIDLKKAGLFALTEGIKTLALEIGILSGNTHEKLQQLQEQGVLERTQVEDLSAAYTLLSFFRLRGQVEEVQAEQPLDNFIAPNSLNRVELGRLRIALDVVRSFQATLRSHFDIRSLG